MLGRGVASLAAAVALVALLGAAPDYYVLQRPARPQHQPGGRVLLSVRSRRAPRIFTAGVAGECLQFQVLYAHTVLHMYALVLWTVWELMVCCGNAASATPERVHALHATPLWVEKVETEKGVALLRRCILSMRTGDAGDGVVRSNDGGEWLQIRPRVQTS